MKQVHKTNPSIPQSTNTIKSDVNTTGRPGSRWTARRLPGWVLLPLRLFLGITFIYAGIQKLTDPQYFNPSTPGYIGKQILGFAVASPIHDFLVHVVVPHAHFFGALVAYGELAIGIGTLLGLLLRPAAFFGMLLSFVFFLSASWRVRPYFYGADIVFVFCWITMLLAGPEGNLMPALDSPLVPRLLLSAPSSRRPGLARLLYILLGVRETSSPTPATTVDQIQGRPTRVNRADIYKGKQTALRQSQARRNFLWGLVTGGAGMLAIVWLGSHVFPRTADDAVPASGSGSPSGSGSTSGTATASGTAGASSTIAHENAVSANSSVSFTIPSNGDPGVLVHLSNGPFVAYDATCTHAGCPVQYDPGSKYLVCPCHGAEFDPAHDAAVVQGPANTPLTAVPIHIDKATGTISISS